MEAALRTVKQKLDGVKLEKVDFEACRGMAGVKEAEIDLNGTKIWIAITSSMTMLCMLIVIVTTVTVIFVETMLIRSKLVREWNNLGVNRALGFTNRDLMHQIMLSNVPALAVGSLLGVILGSLLAANVMQMMLGMFGYEKLTFSIDLLYPVVTFAGILLVAVLVSALNALKVRKLNPVEMITEE